MERKEASLVSYIIENGSINGSYMNDIICQLGNDLHSTDIDTKMSAVRNIIFLGTFGLDTSIASFSVIELIGSTEYLPKKVGYMAAGVCLKENTEALTLCVNMLKKDIFNQNHYIVASVLSSVCHFMNPDLARNIYNDIHIQLNSTISHIRKHAIVTMYKIYKKFPESIVPTIERLVGCLEDKNSSVRLATANVLLELIYDYPGDFLMLTRPLLKILNDTNPSIPSWLIIKAIQILKEFSFVDTKLKKTFVHILVNYLTNNNITLPIIMEVIGALLDLCPENNKIVQMCCEKSVHFFQKNDNNLKYCSLEQLNKIVQHNPEVVLKISSQLQQLLHVGDISIQTRVVSVLLNLLSKDSFDRIMNFLCGFIKKFSCDNSQSKKRFVEFLIQRCIEVCSRNNFALVNSLEWYVDFLFEISNLCINNRATSSGELVSNQLIDLMIRVKALRSYIIPQMAKFIANIVDIFENHPQHVIHKNLHSDSNHHIVSVCVFCCGEYFEFLDNPITFVDIIIKKQCLEFSEDIQYAIVNAAGKIIFKLLNRVFSNSLTVEESVKAEVISFTENIFLQKYAQYLKTSYVRILETVMCYSSLLKFTLENYRQGNNHFSELGEFFNPELQSVAPNVQRKIPLPKGLDLDKWINKNADPQIKKKKNKSIEKKAMKDVTTEKFNTDHNLKNKSEHILNNLNLFGIEPKKKYETKTYEITPINTGDEHTCDQPLSSSQFKSKKKFTHKYEAVKDGDIWIKNQLLLTNNTMRIRYAISSSKKIPTRLIAHIEIKNLTNVKIVDAKLNENEKYLDAAFECASKALFSIKAKSAVKKRFFINTEKSLPPFSWDIGLSYCITDCDNMPDERQLSNARFQITLPLHLFFQIEPHTNNRNLFDTFINKTEKIFTREIETIITSSSEFKECYNEFLLPFYIDDNNYLITFNEPSLMSAIRLLHNDRKILVNIKATSSELLNLLDHWLCLIHSE